MSDYNYFIGTDVSKKTLDMAVFKNAKFLYHKIIKNGLEEIDTFLAEVEALHGFSIERSIFCMEHTGLYCNLLIKKLTERQANIVQEDPGKIKRSIGNARGKNDKVDAIRIAEYAYRFKENLIFWNAKRTIIEQLNTLMVLRSRLLAIKQGVESPITEQRIFMDKSLALLCKNACSKSMKAIAEDLVNLEKQLMDFVRSDERLKRLYDLITSVKAIGKITAIQLIISTNEFRSFTNPKKFACYAGVAPFTHQSGLSTPRARISPMANKKMKALLHNCAVVACRWDDGLLAYYKRKTEQEGKHKMLVLNAIRYKLILRVFACVRQDRKYIVNEQVLAKKPLEESPISEECELIFAD